MKHKNNIIKLCLGIFLAFTMALPAIAQKTQTFKGVVVDTTGEPIIGASVKVVGTTTGTITDLDGKFMVVVPSGKQVAFSTAFPPDLPLVTADPVHIANILSNLIENAIKYSGSGVNIRVVVIRNDKLIELTVADDGVGISADEQTKVFEKFYRSVHLPDKQIPGLGLGLSYVRQIAEAHHGQVSLRSEVGKGTEVTVGLPI